jgi:hypothetical protein
MRHPARLIRSLTVIHVLGLTCLAFPTAATAGPKETAYWRVDDIRPGMKGYGCSVFKGTKIERFDAEVLGVLKNISPGRDLVLVRVSGCDLVKTGVIAGMSGSPVYFDGKLLGAVSYAWAYGKEPIAGVTPFCQMVEYVESFERRDLAQKAKGDRASLEPSRPSPKESQATRRRVTMASGSIQAGGQEYDTATVSSQYEEPTPTAADGMWLVPLQTPLVARGFTRHSLRLLQDRTRWAGLTPMQAGGAAANVIKEAQDAPLEPGSPLAVALITGDFDLSGIGTVTHVEGDRVYGWGHPFLSMGQCDLPLMAGYIHTIYPRLSVSFKMGSPLRTLGVINADVSTGIAGWLGRQPDLMPLQMTVRRDEGGQTKTFNCEVARQRSLLPQLVYTALTNAVDMEGELPEELTAEMETRFEFENRPPVVIHDLYSGPSFSGGRAPAALFSQVAGVIQTLMYNQFQPVRIKRIACDIHLSTGRQSAEIEAVQLDSETYAPGDTVKANVYVRPYKGTRQRVAVRLELPDDLPEGTYTAQFCDGLTNARYELRESPVLYNPTNLDQVFQALEVQAAAKRTNLVLRVAVADVGVALDGQELPNLPGSVVEMLANSRRTGAQTVTGVLVSRQATDWVIQGSQTIKFSVTKNKRLTME